MSKSFMFLGCLLMFGIFLSTTATAEEFSMRKTSVTAEQTNNKNIYVKAGIGGMLLPFSSYKAGFSFGIEGGSRVYRHLQSSLSVGLGVDYYSIDKSGSTGSQQAGTISYSMTGYAIPVLLKCAYTYTINDRIDVYAGIGLGMAASKVDTSISGFSSVSEQSSAFAFSLYPGITINKIGPGALFAEIDFLSSTVSYKTTGSANIGGTLLLLGYSIYF